MAADYCVRAYVSGRVQGVFFRQSTAREARLLGLAGSAVNLPDGRVEVVVIGNKEPVHTLLTWLHTGPPMARVNDVDWQECVRPAELGGAFITA